MKRLRISKSVHLTPTAAESLLLPLSFQAILALLDPEPWLSTAGPEAHVVLAKGRQAGLRRSPYTLLAHVSAFGALNSQICITNIFKILKGEQRDGRMD